ncbi:aluminum activated malate transporter family protein [Arabidopsis thaliana]|uniref:Isoform 3 of Aluminum-activated malate transporter 14 n=1 Tax=Arabidopsis thaliana TaxID=3702 RepID=Q9LS22-3|nr:aluminum activated malate transporter family protein [Arabidopsis thaliana]AED95405.1 aluminum activated malate transporter family protein [Arabidopsis thaliana]|eukprot:NP_001119385.1 aluminum activated malate transporter family protein [Arabidopsis thaliana]
MSDRVHERSMGMEEEGSTKNMKTKVLELPTKIKKILKNIWKVGKDDPRRVKHALKVGVSLTLVSLLYLMEPLFKGIGNSAIWAVMTVVVVLEFSAGALITYLRFIPYIKKNYDYGMLIFLLTFNLITVSSYRVDTVIKIAHERFYTIAMGVGICLLMSLLVFPIWSGEDLHKSTVAKLQGLSYSIEACVNEYFEEEEKDEETSDLSEDTIYNGYKTVLDSKSADEALAMYASWEPRHTRHCHRFPWKHYVKVGSVLRQFGYTVVALHGCLKTEIQTPRPLRGLFKDPCVRLAGEICKVLSELAASIRNRRHCSPEILSDSLQVALQDLNTAIKSQPKLFLGSSQNGNVSQGNSGRHNPNVAVSQHINKDTNEAASYQNTGTPRGERMSRFGPNVSFSRLRADTLERRSAAATNERKILRQQLSRIVVLTSLEFSEALPFAAFASLLVEMVARLDNVIEEVEELGTIACFKDYDNNVDQKDVEVRVEKPADLVVGVE